jgi:5-formyltetrahydrofolate cyclo-ligase
LFNHHQNFACYFALTNEFDCTPIIKIILAANKKCFLPSLSIRGNNTLEFALYQPDQPLQFNRYQIPEPMFAEKISADLLDVVIFPLVGFDLHGHRLGMGGGYYDRTFHFHTKNTKPYLLGLGYESQKVASLPHETWDIALQGVLTESKLYSF